MTNAATLDKQIADLSTRLQAKLNLRPAPFGKLVAKAKRHLPRRVYQNALTLVEAQPVAQHPKLSRTLDYPELTKSVAIVASHLDAIDLADARTTRRLNLLGRLVMNLISVVILVIAVLMWRGFI